jgi:hypothetical protein
VNTINAFLLVLTRALLKVPVFTIIVIFGIYDPGSMTYQLLLILQSYIAIVCVMFVTCEYPSMTFTRYVQSDIYLVWRLTLPTWEDIQVVAGTESHVLSKLEFGPNLDRGPQLQSVVGYHSSAETHDVKLPHSSLNLGDDTLMK